MTPRRFPILIVFACALALGALAACGGDGNGDSGSGILTDPETVPTSTPWENPPEVIMLDPNALPTLAVPTVAPATTPPRGDGEDGGETSGNCGPTYTVQAGDTMFGIAEFCGVSVDDLTAANPDSDPSALTIGEELVIP